MEQAEVQQTWARRTFKSLENPNYRRYFAGQAVSSLGTWMQSVALSWLVLELTGSATLLGVVFALQTVPILLMAPYGGLTADRLPKRPLLMVTQGLSSMQALLLAILTLTGTVTVAWVMGLALMLGCINAFDMPTRQAFVREMVSPEDVRNAISLNASLVNASRAIGPAIGGIIIATVGVGECFLVNCFTFTGSIVALASMNVRLLTPSVPAPRERGQLRQGLSYVRRSPILYLPLLMMFIVGMLTYEFQVSLPALAVDTFQGNASTMGLLTGAMGVGAVIGGLISASRSTASIRSFVVTAAVFGVLVTLAAISPSVPFALLALVGAGASSIWFMSIGNTTLQLNSDPQMRGRVMSLWFVAFMGSTPIGAPIIGLVAQHAGPRWALIVGGVAALAAALLGLTIASRVGLLKRQSVAAA